MSTIAAIAAAAKAAAIPPALLLSVCFTESGFRNTLSPTDGKSASYGVCQVKLATARMFNPKVHASTLMNPKVNAMYAAIYLKYQLRRYGYDVRRAVCAYNSGSHYYPNRGCAYSDRVLGRVRQYE